MWFFKKKEVMKDEDGSLVTTNYKSIETLLVLNKDKAFGEKLTDLQRELRYLIPSNDAKTIAADKNIRGQISELKVLLSRSDMTDTRRLEDALSEIRVTIAERQAKVGE